MTNALQNTTVASSCDSNHTLPAIKLEAIHRIFDDGAHNAFTDLCRFGDFYYVTFRSSPIGHDVLPGSTIVVLRSADGRDWQPVHRFGVPDRDVRDPHLLVFGNRLWIFTGTWLCNGRKDLAEHQGYGTSTADGLQWEKPFALEGTYGWFVWRAVAFEGRVYLTACTRRHVDVPGTPGRAEGSTILFQSEDCRHWHRASVIETHRGNENAFGFESDGRILAIVRQDLEHMLLARSTPPYDQWTLQRIDRYIGGPLLVRWNGMNLVGGRKFLAPGQPDNQPRMILSWLHNDQLHDALELPSGGDTAYPGFVALDDNRALISYYSSHEGSGDKKAPAHIYMAHIRFIL
jgi:hypothetical protein